MKASAKNFVCIVHFFMQTVFEMSQMAVTYNKKGNKTDELCSVESFKSFNSSFIIISDMATGQNTLHTHG